MDDSEDLILMTDPNFWEKAKQVDKLAVDGVLQEPVPFDLSTLLYYLIFSPKVKGIENLSTKEKVVFTTIISETEKEARYVYTSPNKTRNGWILFNNYGLFENKHGTYEDRDHLKDQITNGSDKEFLKSRLKYPKKQIFDLHDRPEIKAICGPDLDGFCLKYPSGNSEARLKIYFNSYSSNPRDIRDIYQGQALPIYLFLNVGSFKIICREFHAKRKQEERDVFIMTATTTSISLAYWNEYVEPWLHLPEVIPEEVVECWTENVGTFTDLQKTIIQVILVPCWDDALWLGAKKLCTW